MNGPEAVNAKRARLREQLFPGGVPLLWCPPLTHYDRDGAIDGPRMRAHLRHLSRSLKGLLVPGSTGDGWEMNDQEIRQVLDLALSEAQDLGVHVLIGVLKADEREALTGVRDTLAWLETRASTEPGTSAPPLPAPVCGFTVCAPRGNQKTQKEISSALAAILREGLPTALYQLPQVTQNEIAPETLSDLAMRFENFVLFKDSSGSDRAVLSGQPLGGVFTMRGGEGDYARWLNTAGGSYDGFLLGSANCFAAELAEIIGHISARRLAPARQLSDSVTAVVGEVSAMVAGLPDGNPFANANKAIDHFYAWGPRAASQAPPRLHAGSSLPAALVRAAGDSLSRHGLLPAKGYL